MTPAELLRLIERSGLSKEQAAAKLGVHLRTLWRWLRDETPIDKRNALFIRSVLK